MRVHPYHWWSCILKHGPSSSFHKSGLSYLMVIRDLVREWQRLQEVSGHSFMMEASITHKKKEPLNYGLSSL